MAMKVLVIGGAGFLGSNLVRRCLLDENAEVTVLDSLDPRFHSSQETFGDISERIHFVRGDLCDEGLTSELVQGQDLIFNCAAQPSHTLSVRNPLLDAEINCLGNLKLLEAVCRFNPGVGVVYPSSSTVIGKASEGPVDESSGENPLEIYSANKGVAEKYYQIYHSLHGLKTVVLRFANLYGPYGKGYPEFGFVNYFIHLAWTDQAIPIFGDGSQIRNVMYVEDAAEILWRAAQDQRLFGKSFFATSPDHLSVREMAETIVATFERGRVTYVEWPPERRPIEIGSVRFSSARLSSITGWKPHYDFVSGLKRTRETMEKSLQEVKGP